MSLVSLLDRLRGRPIEHDLSPYREALARVSALEPAMTRLTDASLTERARALRDRVAGGVEVEAVLTEVETRLLRAEIARAQRVVEDEGFQMRRTLFGYSDIVERQRRAIQRWRSAVLDGREPRHLLADRAGERHERLLPMIGQKVLDEVERRLTLLAIDRCWSDHLAELRELREDSVLLAFAGRFPLAEFHRQAAESFQALEARIEDEAVRDFERISITTDAVDWEREGLRGPSATWTYLVGENPFGASGMISPAGRTGTLAAAAGVPWLVLLQGLGVLWERRRRRG